ncbi:MAG: phospholipid carrier-dependent glycosyltransferase [Chloroflexi bacterium]|nr:phospholipid carrier-dependent glycosyltransferase [Chloroflexota bacterium]
MARVVSRVWIGLHLGMALAAMAALTYYLRPWGPWAFTDSVAYVDAARGVLAGRGLVVRQDPEQTIPLAHYPPLYPLALAAVMGCCRVDWLVAARWIDVAVYGVFVFVLAELGRRAWPQQPWVGTLTAAFLAASPVVARNFSGIMTEPMFFTLIALTMASLWMYWQRAWPGWLRLAGVSAAAAVLTRYAGLFLAPALVLVPWVGPDRWRRAGLALGPFGLAYGVWNVIMHIRGNTLHFGWPTKSEVLAKTWALIQALPEVVWLGWLEMPQGYKRFPYLAWVWVGVTAGLLLVLLVVMGRRGWMRREAQSDWRIWQVVMLAWGLALAYLAFFYVAFLFRRPEPDFTPRVASPLFWLMVYGWLWAPFGVIAWIIRTGRRWRHWLGYALGLGYGLVLLGMLYHQVWVTKKMLYELRGYGLGYTAKPWHQPAAWAELRAWPEEIPLVADEAEALLLWADRPAYLANEVMGPVKIYPLGEGPFPYHRAYREGRVAVVHFLPSWPRWVRLYQHRADEAVDLLFHRREPCWRNELFELFYNGSRAAELCITGERSGP